MRESLPGVGYCLWKLWKTVLIQGVKKQKQNKNKTKKKKTHLTSALRATKYATGSKLLAASFIAGGI